MAPYHSNNNNNGNQQQQQLTMYQKMFNQRLLAEHCMTEEYAEYVYYQEIIPSISGMNDDTNNIISFTDTIKQCNQQLHNFGLEIIAITIPTQYTTSNSSNSSSNTNSSNTNTNDNNDDDDDDDDDEEEENDRRHPNRRHSVASTTSSTMNSQSQNTKTKSTTTTTKYYVMMNTFPDTITKDIFIHQIFSNTTMIHPQYQSYMKHILQHCIQQYPKPSTRSTIINLRNTTTTTTSSSTSSNTKKSNEDNDENRTVVTTMTQQQQQQQKLSLTNAEDLVERLIEEHWLMEIDVIVSNGNNNNNPKKKKNSNKRIALGPRSFGELSYILHDMMTVMNENNNNNNDDNDDDDTMPQHQRSTTTTILPQPVYIRL